MRTANAEPKFYVLLWRSISSMGGNSLKALHTRPFVHIVVSMACTFLVLVATFLPEGRGQSASEFRNLPWIELSPDRDRFVQNPGGAPFIASGYNYDHDESGRLIEDYWEAEWERIESDFAEMKQLGGRVIRIHLQFGKIMQTIDDPNRESVDRVKNLLRLAERHELYLNLTGLGCYHKKDVPKWYDQLDEEGRWKAQAHFWKVIATACKDSPALFCYDLMNEPVVPGGKRNAEDWLGPPFAGKHFVQMITLDQQNRPRHEIARRWIDHMVQAIRATDTRHLITLGMVDWSLDRPGLTSGFDPHKVAQSLDFLSVHLYPESKKIHEAKETLRLFRIGKPLVVEETYPLRCSVQELVEFQSDVGSNVDGWISFYWGSDPNSLSPSKDIGSAIQKAWLEAFRP